MAARIIQSRHYVTLLKLSNNVVEFEMSFKYGACHVSPIDEQCVTQNH